MPNKKLLIKFIIRKDRKRCKQNALAIVYMETFKTNIYYKIIYLTTTTKKSEFLHVNSLILSNFQYDFALF